MGAGWLGSKPRQILVVGDRAMAVNWARQQGIDPRYVIATTEGDHRLRGLGYVPVLIHDSRVPDHVYSSHRHRAAMEAWNFLDAMYNPERKKS